MGEFADSYLQGETPVPCVACNQKIKFHDLLETAEGLGASALATGHYVRSEPGQNGWELYRAADKERDQSYFLFATTPEQLAFLRFPLGHRGIINYTIGQRKGIGVPAKEPLYVLKLDASRREVVVGAKECLRTRMLKLRDVNWLGDEPFAAFALKGEEVLARIRSSGPLQPARLSLVEEGVTVELAHGEDGVSPGQACVFYAAKGGGERRLGGGWIKSAAGGLGLARDGFQASASGAQEAFAAGSR